MNFNGAAPARARNDAWRSPQDHRNVQDQQLVRLVQDGCFAKPFADIVVDLGKACQT